MRRAPRSRGCTLSASDFLSAAGKSTRPLTVCSTPLRAAIMTPPWATHWSTPTLRVRRRGCAAIRAASSWLVMTLCLPATRSAIRISCALQSLLLASSRLRRPSTILGIAPSSLARGTVPNACSPASWAGRFAGSTGPLSTCPMRVSGGSAFARSVAVSSTSTTSLAFASCGSTGKGHPGKPNPIRPKRTLVPGSSGMRMLLNGTGSPWTHCGRPALGFAGSGWWRTRCLITCTP